MRKLFKNKKGQGLVEYGLIIAGVALICAAAISVFGHKTSDLISATAAVLPGSHAGDNAAITSGALIETSEGAAGDAIELDADAILAASGTGRLGNNVLGAGTIAGNVNTPRLGNNTGVTGEDFGGLIVEAGE